ncbi:MAG: putative bifunctional diguanylate cyclase/phosphodiesterase [Solirubrobacteraceae bacterium]
MLARSFAYLYGAGASLILLTLLLPHGSDRSAWPIVVVAAVAYANVLVLLTRFDRLPLWLFQWMPPAGCVLVSVVIVAGGSDLVVAYAAIYFWVVLSAHYFFSARVGALNTAFVALVFAVVLELAPEITNREIKWLTLIAALAVSGLLVSLLRGRVAGLFGRLEDHAARSDALARFSREALEPDGLGHLPAAAARLLHEAFGVDCADVLLLGPDGQSLNVAAAAGWRLDIVGNSALHVDPSSLTGRALLSSEPVFADEHPGLTRSSDLAREGIRSTLLMPLRGRDEAYGLIAVHSRLPRAFSASDAAQFEAVAGVLAGAVDRGRAADRLRHQAYHDDLTGQPNRHLFMERLDGALGRARKERTTLAVLFLDLDNFKVLNDSLGHQAGDSVLVALVPRLRKALYLSDTIARFGGDEFVLLCEGVEGETGAIDIAERIHAAFEEPFAIGGAVHRLTVSVGVAVTVDGDGEPEALLRDADAALSRAKAEGRDRTALYDSGMHGDAMARLQMEGALHDALDLGQLRLVYQPIVDLADGRIVACEALLRWTHPVLGDVPPVEMIPVAEETGVIVRIGEWVIEEACATAAHWRRLAGDAAPGITVNVSPRQLVAPALPGHIAGVLRDTGVAASDVVIEITESTLIEENSVATERLSQLRSLGLRLALDDFGTGYSSLSYLRRFAVDTVKIDRSFVATMDDAAGGDAIVAAILGLAAGLGSRAVAEGIETPQQLERLRSMGCRLGQGYLFARPLSGGEIEALLGAGGVIPAAGQASSSVA